MSNMLRVTVVMVMSVVAPAVASAQDRAAFDPTGYWTGAIIKDGSVLPLTLDISADAEGYSAATRFPDWLFYVPKTRERVILTETGLVVRDLLSGDAVMVLEPRHEQLTGHLGDDGRKIHLKRSVPPPKPLAVSTDTEFVSADGTRLSGTLTLPRDGEMLGGVVMVRGRGCASRVNGRARFLAEYGMAVLTYDKRGAGDSEGDCSQFTFGDLVADADAAFRHLLSQPRVDAGRVGFFGESAGAWTVQAATERLLDDADGPRPAFIVTWVGPSTSILQQQISSAATYGESIGLTKAQQEVLVEATRIIADETLSDDAAYARLEAIRLQAERDGWLDRGFGADDLPRERAEMDRLWLRRFRYDPSAFLNGLGGFPYLSILGAKDPIVPVAENAQTLRTAAPEARVVVLPESGHGYDHDGQVSQRLDGEPMWVFEGPDVGFMAETIAFLRDIGIASR